MDLRALREKALASRAPAAPEAVEEGEVRQPVGSRARLLLTGRCKVSEPAQPVNSAAARFEAQRVAKKARGPRVGPPGPWASAFPHALLQGGSEATGAGR